MNDSTAFNFARADRTRSVIGLEIFRGAIMRAMDIARDVADGAGVWFSLCFEYML